MNECGGSLDQKLADIDGACCVCQACLYIFSGELRVRRQDVVGVSAPG